MEETEASMEQLEHQRRPFLGVFQCLFRPSSKCFYVRQKRLKIVKYVSNTHCLQTMKYYLFEMASKRSVINPYWSTQPSNVRLLAMFS